jgi:hypothetical protein
VAGLTQATRGGLAPGRRRGWRRTFALAALAVLVPGHGHAADDDGQPQLQLEPGAHASLIRRLAVDPARGIAVTASDDKTARVWDLATGALRHVLRPPVGPGERGRLYGAALHPSKPVVAVGGTTRDSGGRHWIYLFDTESGRMAGAFDARAGDVRRLAWSADGSLLWAAYAGNDGVRAFDPAGRVVFEEPFAGPAFGMAVSTSGLVAATGMDGSVRIYRAAGGRVERVRAVATATAQAASVAFSPDARRIAVGFLAERAGVEVIDVERGERIRQFALPRLAAGYLMTVAWSADGSAVLAGGSGYLDGNRFPVYSFAPDSGATLRQDVVARNSVFDIVALPGGGYAYASADGTWGVVDARGRVAARGLKLADLRGASQLRLGGDGRRVRWTFDFGADPATFDFARRVVTAGEGADVRTAVTGTGVFGAGPRVEIGGRPIALERGEVARAIAYLGRRSDAALATSRALYRVDALGNVAWRVAANTEIWAVNASDDGRLIVGALGDGTIRWWRASDGAHLLTLYVVRDGRWVAWTPNGYYDASAGADRLVGWSVNRGPSEAADFFSLGRFRERLNRPDVIDRVFETLDVAQAIVDANQAAAQATAVALAPAAAPVRPAATAAATSPPTATPPEPVPPAAPRPSPPPEPVAVTPVTSPAITVNELPPALGALESTVLRTTGKVVSIPFTLRSQGGRIDIEVEVRIDGRPARLDDLALPTSLDGAARGLARLSVPESGSLVQLFARSKNGVSEPLSFLIERPEPAPPAAPEPVRAPASGAAPAPAPSAATAPAPASAPASTTAASTVAAAPAVAAPTIPAPLPAKPAEPARPIQRPPIAPQASLYVLAVGVSGYQRAEYQLGLAAKDARDFAAAMQRQQGRLYREVVVRTLTDRQATRAEVQRGLDWLASAVGPDDVAMLFIAGHGVNEPAGQYYFLPYDAQHERLASTAVPERSIRNTLGRIRGKALFFVDTCFAGNAIGTFRSASRELARLASDLASSENGVVVFASSSGRQVSEEKDEWGNGAFTKALIEGLSGRADLTNTGRVTFKGLDFFVSEEVRKLTQGRQTPVTISPAGVPDFALARI